jgi:hypothetical protein
MITRGRWIRLSAFAVPLAIGAMAIAPPLGAVPTPESQPAGKPTLSGQTVTLTLGQKAKPGQIDAADPNDDLETGIRGEKPAPTDTLSKPTAAQTGTTGSSPNRSAAPEKFTVFRNTPTNPKGGGAVSEPTGANDGNVILAMGNTWAQLSNDNGLTWPSSLIMNPGANPPNDDKVCCDQVTYSVDRGDHTMTFWLLQNDCGGVKCGGDNPRHQNALTLRMFPNQTSLLSAAPCDFTLHPSLFGLKKDFFDFDKVSSTDKFLYISSDIHTLKHHSDGVGIIRFSLDDLDNGNCKVDSTFWRVRGQDSLAPVEHAGSTMFFASHVHDVAQGDQLRIYKIPDSSTKLSHVDRNVTNYAGNDRGKGSCKAHGDDPCRRFNDNQTVGFRSSKSIGWLWTAPQDHNFSFRQVRVAVFRTSDQKLVKEDTIWNKKYAWTYPAVGVNSRGDLGVVVYQMGGGNYPTPFAFIRTKPRDWSGLTLHQLVKGTATFKTNTWGDYASVHRYNGCGNTFLSTVWSVQKSSGTTVAENRAVWFGDPDEGCADLVVTAALALPTQLHTSDTLSIAEVTKNLGATAPPTSTRYYFSKDAVKSSDDILLTGATAVQELFGGGEVGTGNTPASVIIPNMSAGTYRLLACANDTKTVDETTRANNCLSPAVHYIVLAG